MKTQHRGRARSAVALGIASAVVLAGCAAGSEEETPEGFAPDDEEIVFVDGVLQPLSDGFPSSALTLVVVDEAGSDDGIYARTFAEAARDISPVDIRIDDRPEFGATYGAWEAIDWTSEQRGGDEGYYVTVVTLPGSTLDLLETPVTADLGSTMESLNTIMLTESVPYIIVTRPDAPWGTDFSAMLEYAQANPGEVKYISRGPGAGPNIAMQAYLQTAGGVDLNTSIGGSHPEIMTALGAGVGDVAVTLPGAASPFLQDGTVQLMTCTGNLNPCAANWGEQRPNAASQLGIDNDPWGSGRGLVTAEGIPESHRLWLEALVKSVTEQDSFIKARTSIPGVGMAQLNKADALELQKVAYRFAYPIIEALGNLVDGAPLPD